MLHTAIEWKVVQPQEISIEGNINDSLSSVKRLVGYLAPLREASHGSVFRLDAGNEPRYVEVHPPFRGTAVCFTLPRS